MTRTLHFLLLALAGCTAAPKPNIDVPPSAAPVVDNSEDHLQVAQYPLGPVEDADGNLWLGSVGSGAMLWNGDSLRYFHSKDGLLGDRVTGLTLDPEGTFWLVSAGEDMGQPSALMTWDGTQLNRAVHPTGFPRNAGGPLFAQDGTMWLESEGQFYREVNGVFEVFPLPEPSLPRTNTTGYEPIDIDQFQSGDFWFSTSDQGAYRWDGEAFQQLTTAQGLTTNNVSVHLEDQHGNLWISCFHWHLNPNDKRGALCVWDGEQVTTFPEVTGLTQNEIYSVFEDRDGNIWICATGHGVYCYDGTTFKFYNQTSPALDEFPMGCNSIYQDRKGRLWFGFTGGLYRLEGETFVNITRGGPWN